MTVVFLNKFTNPYLTLDRVLTEFFGVNARSADFIISGCGLSSNLKLYQLRPKQLQVLELIIEDFFKIDKERVLEVKSFEEKFIYSNNIRSFRYRNRLPLNGQRTHSNAQNAK